ncbi:hypothetical protein KUCAC02_008694, partial [Chaenocephalus aceratus]
VTQMLQSERGKALLPHIREEYAACIMHRNAEMTTARNKEPALMDNGEKKEEGASMWGGGRLLGGFLKHDNLFWPKISPFTHERRLEKVTEVWEIQKALSDGYSCVGEQGRIKRPVSAGNPPETAGEATPSPLLSSSDSLAHGHRRRTSGKIRAPSLKHGKNMCVLIIKACLGKRGFK